MAHHGRTAASILAAPKLAPRHLSISAPPTRLQRREQAKTAGFFFAHTRRNTDGVIVWRPQFREAFPALNTPYVNDVDPAVERAARATRYRPAPGKRRRFTLRRLARLARKVVSA